MREGHWSIFEMASVCMEINTTRDIGRQILRHRSFSFQEFSQRYADVNTLETPFSFRECRMQDVKNRQNSLETNDHELRSMWVAQQQKVLRAARESYQWALDNGVAKEQARALLPEGLTMSKMYMSGTLRSWLHFTGVRADKATQKEHREVAEQAIEILKQEFPVTMLAAKEHFYKG
jgi:thymidylate synthase (FAD)